MLSIPRTSPRADAFFEILHDLCGDAAVNVFSFGGVLHRLLLLKKQTFSSRKPATVLKAFSGADLSRARFFTRSSKTLDREHRWNNAVFLKARVEWRRNGREKTSLRTPNEVCFDQSAKERTSY